MCCKDNYSSDKGAHLCIANGGGQVVGSIPEEGSLQQLGTRQPLGWIWMDACLQASLLCVSHDCAERPEFNSHKC